GLQRLVRLPQSGVRLAGPGEGHHVVRVRLQSELETGNRFRRVIRPQETQTLRAVGPVVVRVLLEDDREEGEGIVEMGFVCEAGRLATEEIEVVVFQDEAVLEDLQGLWNPADLQEDVSFRRERDPVSEVQAHRAIEGLERLPGASQSGEESPL